MTQGDRDSKLLPTLVSRAQLPIHENYHRSLSKPNMPGDRVMNPLDIRGPGTDKISGEEDCF